MCILFTDNETDDNEYCFTKFQNIRMFLYIIMELLKNGIGQITSESLIRYLYTTALCDSSSFSPGFNKEKYNLFIIE